MAIIWSILKALKLNKRACSLDLLLPNVKKKSITDSTKLANQIRVCAKLENQMTVYHHRSADHVAKYVLNKWRNGVWLNNYISTDVTLAHSPADFPSPDSDFQDFTKKTRVSLEFKPFTETKRGMMTGIGQAIAYLRKANASYLVSPSVIDGFDMEGFLKTTFETFIKGKIPVGLIVYDGEDLSNIRLSCDIELSSTTQVRQIELTEEPYWCWWRDAPPDLILKLGLSAQNTQTKTDRSKAVWNYFWDNYFAIPPTRTSIENVDSDVFAFDLNSKMIPFESLKKSLRKEVAANTINHQAALQILKEKGWGQGFTENNYQNYKKNFTIIMDHVNFWDENKELTPLGERFVSRNHLPLSQQRVLIDEFAQIVLVEGRHENLISDIEKVNKVLTNITGQDKYLDDIHDYLDGQGYISKNPNRITSGSRKFLQAEKQLWGHLSLIKKNGRTYFHPGKGFIFDRQRIEALVESFYKNYSDVSSFIDQSNEQLVSIN